MSYFAANAISIDRDRHLFRVKGGDNNVVPRSNFWTDWRPLRELLPALSGGGVQLTTRSERAVHIDQLHARLTPDCRNSPATYTLAGILRGNDRTALAECYRQGIADWQGDFGTHMSADYVARQVAKLEQLPDILGDPGQLEAIDAMNGDFCSAVCHPVRSGTHVVTNGYGYILRTYRGGARTTSNPAAAKRFSEAKAQEVAARFTGWTVQEVAV